MAPTPALPGAMPSERIDAWAVADKSSLRPKQNGNDDDVWGFPPVATPPPPPSGSRRGLPNTRNLDAWDEILQGLSEHKAWMQDALQEWYEKLELAQDLARQSAEYHRAQTGQPQTFDSVIEPLKSSTSKSSKGTSKRASENRAGSKRASEARRASLEAKAADDDAKKDQPKAKTSQHSYLAKVNVARNRPLWKFVHGDKFQCLSFAIIFLNGIFIGFNCQTKIEDAFKRSKAGDMRVFYIEIVFTAWFTLELLIRLAAERLLFFHGPECRWNCFESFLVLTTILDFTALSIVGLSTGRVLRLARFLRIFRAGKVLKLIRSFRIVVFTLMESVAKLAWCLIIIAFVIYVFAIFFITAVADHMNNTRVVIDDDFEASAKKYYGSILRAIATLWMSISGGIDWNDAVDPLRKMSWFYEPVFNAYIFFMVLGVMNVVVGVFVNSTREVAEKDQLAIAKAQTSHVESCTRKLTEAFESADRDGTGMLALSDLEDYLLDPGILAYFQALEMDVSQAKVLFKMLDSDCSNSVPTLEYLDGCRRLQSSAKNTSVNMLTFQTENLCDQFHRFVEYSTSQFEKIDEEFTRNRRLG